MTFDLEEFYKDVNEYIRKKHVEYVLAGKGEMMLPFSLNDDEMRRITSKYVGFFIEPALEKRDGQTIVSIYYKITARWYVSILNSEVSISFEIHPLMFLP